MLVAMTDDTTIQARITELVETERRLRERLAAGEITEEQEHEDLRRAEVELDQAWDLLRQRRARAEFGQDPDEAAERSATVVENYLD